MIQFPAESRDPIQPDLTAAEWVVRADRGLDADEQREFAAWLAAHPEHRESFARQHATWLAFDALARPQSAAANAPQASTKRSRRRAAWLVPLLAAAAIAIGVGLRRSSSPAFHPAPAIADAEAAPESRVLNDGSVVDMNQGAAMQVEFTPGERRVELMRGEAHFTVAKNPRRPFIVSAAGVAVRAVGTAFNVSLEPTAVVVLVTEGHVRIDSTLSRGRYGAAAPCDVIAGQRASIPLVSVAQPAEVKTVSADEVTRAVRWQPQWLHFDSAPLQEVVDQFNRYNRTHLVVADPALAQTPIVASFRANNVDGFVRLLELTSAIDATRTGETITLQPAR